MRYKYLHKLIFRVFIFILIALFLFLIGYYSSRCFNLFGLWSKNLAFEISVIAFAVVFILILVSILFLSYKVKDDTLTLKILFYDTFQGQLKISKIYKLVWAKRDNKLILCYTDKNMQQRIAFINIAEKRYEEFSNKLKKLNPNIIYEVNE